MALNLAILPVFAGLMAGTGAMAAYVVTPASAPTTVAPQAAELSKSCEAQTWPYIDNRCMSSARMDRKVRVVMASRDGEASASESPAPTMNAPTADAPQKLVTRDTVGRAPEVQTPAVLPVPQTPKRTEKRRATRQAYEVPSDADRRDRRSVIVVRPLRLDGFR
jgi:hypothetical protein